MKISPVLFVIIALIAVVLITPASVHASTNMKIVS